MQQETKWNWKRLGPAGVLGVLWALFPAICGFVLLGSIGRASDWLGAMPETGIYVYIAIFIVSAGFGLLPTYSQAILGGWVFGIAGGFLAALAGFTGASVIGFFITRLVSQDKVEKEIADHVKARAVRDALIGHGFWRTLGTVALLRFPPNSPFALTNLAMSSAGVKLIPFIIGTAIGMAPRTAVAVVMAAKAADTGAKDIQAFLDDSKGILTIAIGLVVMFAVLALIGWIANQAIAKVLVEDDSLADDATNE